MNLSTTTMVVMTWACCDRWHLQWWSRGWRCPLSLRVPRWNTQMRRSLAAKRNRKWKMINRKQFNDYRRLSSSEWRKAGRELYWSFSKSILTWGLPAKKCISSTDTTTVVSTGTGRLTTLPTLVVWVRIGSGTLIVSLVTRRGKTSFN